VKIRTGRRLSSTLTEVVQRWLRDEGFKNQTGKAYRP